MELFCKMKLPGALKAKGGITGDSVGNPRTAHLHSHVVGSDRGRDPSGR